MPEETDEVVDSYAQNRTWDKEVYDDVCRIKLDLEAHFERPLLTMPLTFDGKSLYQLEVPCHSCGYQTVDLRGTATEKFDILEVESWSYCLSCNKIMEATMRFYKDGHMTVKTPDGWVNLIFVEQPVPSKITNALSKIKNFFSRKK